MERTLTIDPTLRRAAACLVALTVAALLAMAALGFVHVSSAALPSRLAGFVVGVVAIALSVSWAWMYRRVRARMDVLREQSDQRERALRVARVSEWEWDLGSGAIRWSDETFRIHGLDPATYVPTRAGVFDLVHADDRERMRAFVQAMIDTGEQDETEFRIVRPDGSERLLLSRGGRDTTRDGRAVLRSILQDITPLGDMRQRLARVHADYRFLFDANPLPMWVFDLETLRFLAVNDAMAARYGHSREALLGMTILDIRDREQEEFVRFHLGRSDARRPQGDVGTHRHSDGSVIRMRLYHHEISFDGRPCLLVAAEDITEREAVEQRFRLVTRATSDAVWDWTIATDALWWSPSFQRTFGYAEHDIPATLQGWQARIHEEDRARVVDSLYGAANDPAADEWQARYRFRHHDGRYRDILDRGFVLRDEHGVAIRVLGGMLDETEKRRADALMRLLERTVESTVNGIVIADAQLPDMPMVYVNPAFERITGYSPADALGRNCRFLQGDQPDPRATASIRAALQAETTIQLVMRNYRKDGTLFWNELKLAPIKDAQGRLTHYVGIQDDISARHQLEAQLAYAASHDPLTGLANRNALRRRLQRMSERRQAQAGAAALLFIDLDNFKLINDALGHETGDAVLKEIAARLLKATGPFDLVARFGGDEFVVLMQTRRRAALDIDGRIERLQAEFQKPIAVGGGTHYVTSSIGFVRLPGAESDADRLLMQADLAMYQAKQMGRNRAVEYTAGFDAGVSRRLGLITEIREALRCEQFVLHFHPIVRADGRVSGVEALVRWKHPKRGLLSPAEFIGECEASGLVVPLGRWVMQEAGRCARALIDGGGRHGALRMSVNVSALQFQRSLLADAEDVLQQFALPEDAFELELTETTLMANAEEGVEVMRALRAQRVQVAIDDFGTGYSSLAYLKRLPINRLKIDRSFVRDFATDREDAGICTSIIRLAQTLGLHTVAEGVETQAQRDWLVGQGCDELQGFLFARPMPLDALREWLGERSLAHAAD